MCRLHLFQFQTLESFGPLLSALGQAANDIQNATDNVNSTQQVMALMSELVCGMNEDIMESFTRGSQREDDDKGSEEEPPVYEYDNTASESSDCMHCTQQVFKSKFQHLYTEMFYRVTFFIRIRLEKLMKRIP